MLVEWGRPSSTCRRALFLPGVRENEGHSRPRRERRARTPDRICLDIDNEDREAARRRCCRRPGEGSPRFFCLHPLSSFISFVFTELFMQQASREDLAFFNAVHFFCLKKAQAKQEFVFLNTIFLLKRNQSSNQSSWQQDHQEGKVSVARRFPWPALWSCWVELGWCPSWLQLAEVALG